MTADEIDALVKGRAEMPEDLNIAEMSYFTTMENIHNSGITRLEKYHRYKWIRIAFEDCQREIAIYQDTCRMRVEVAKVAREMTVSGCPICKRAIAIFDGRMKVNGDHECKRENNEPI